MRLVKNLLIVTIVLGLSIPTFTAVASEEKYIDALTTTSGKNVKVKHLEKEHKINNQKTIEIANRASKAIKEEKEQDHKNKNKAAEGTYNFISSVDGISYLYEETQFEEPTLTIVDKSSSDAAQNERFTTQSSKKGAVQIAGVGTDFIKDGIGGRQRITMTSSTYLSAVMKLPASADPGSWNYGGWNYDTGGTGIGSFAGEMGLQYYSNLGNGTQKGWKPVLILKKKISNTGVPATDYQTYSVDFDPSPYNNVQWHNGYIEGASINYYTYYNSSNYVRMKLIGTALCADSACNIQSQTQLTTIMETDQTVPISSISYYKLVSSIVTTSTTGNNNASFSSIKVGTTAVPSANFATPDIDHATVTRNSSNTVTIDND